MVSFDTAIKKIGDAVFPFSIEEIPLSDANLRYLAEEIISPIDLPPFDQSAMDGYAIIQNDMEELDLIQGEIKAGDSGNISISKGQAIRIFTGAPVPPNVDMVVPLEYTVVFSDKIAFESSKFRQGANIRKQGDQQRANEIAVRYGTRITAAVSGYIAALGIRKVKVRKQPKIGVITSGNELKSTTGKLKEGEIFESNSFTIASFFNQLGVPIAFHLNLPDDASKTLSTLKAAIKKADVLIITGGMSVGNFDFVYPSLLNCDVEEVFYKVDQKPGKPIFFGKKENHLIFGLPGNPAAVLTCLYQYVYPMFEGLMGSPIKGLPRLKFKLNQDLQKPESQTRFLKGLIANHKLEILGGQESHMLKSYIEANCLVLLPSGTERFYKGDEVEVQLLVI